MSELTALFTRASKLWRNASDEAMKQHGVRVGQNLVCPGRLDRWQ